MARQDSLFAPAIQRHRIRLEGPKFLTNSLHYNGNAHGFRFYLHLILLFITTGILFL